MAESRGRRPWSPAEVEATVADYLAMLILEQRGEPFNKAERNRSLRTRLEGRSKGAVERKHQNITAVLLELGLPYVDGYKPLGNYQELLREVTRDQVVGLPELINAIEAEIAKRPVVPAVDDILRLIVNPPERRKRDQPLAVREHPHSYGTGVNYLLREARNAALGRAGEEFVVNVERARLLAAGHDRLADLVEHVSRTRGDHLGYDILSYAPSGMERLIEVKTTGFGAHTPFYVTRTELEVSRAEASRYSLHRVFGFRRSPKLFALDGPVDRSCELRAEQFVARVG